MENNETIKRNSADGVGGVDGAERERLNDKTLVSRLTRRGKRSVGDGAAKFGSLGRLRRSVAPFPAGTPDGGPEAVLPNGTALHAGEVREPAELVRLSKGGRDV